MQNTNNLANNLNNNLTNALNQANELMNLNLQTQQVKNLIYYIQILQKWNKVYNLTAITDSYEILVKHIIDCLAVLPYIYNEIENKFNNVNNLNILDIGSGAGLPSIIWSIVNPDWIIYSVDAVHKKIAFQNQVKLELKLNNFLPEHIRIQNFQDKFVRNHQEKFNIITARAYADTSDILQQTNNLLTNNGFYALLKGKDSEEFNLDNKYDINKISINPPLLNAERHLLIIKEV